MSVNNLKKSVVMFSLLFVAKGSFAQTPNWTWLSGEHIRSGFQTSVYADEDVAHPLNVISERTGVATMVSEDGVLWGFGGRGYDDKGGSGLMNDLWKYDGSNWIWVDGLPIEPTNPVNQIGVFGTLRAGEGGQFGLYFNGPGGLEGASAWAGENKVMWLFGGYGNDSLGVPGYMNTVWRFDPSIGQWTWMSGRGKANIAGQYVGGIDERTPGGRSNTVTWQDEEEGDLWVFGGQGIDSHGNVGWLNDIWRFDVIGAYWTLIGGSDSLAVEGDPANNVISGRSGAVSWYDEISDVLYVFGGYGYDANGSEVVGWQNDLWKWDGVSWTALKTSAPSSIYTGQYGTQGVPSASNIPGGRQKGAGWFDADGNLMLFGGIGYGKTDVELGDLNDTWKFDLTTLEWTWVSGNDSVNVTAVYGEMGEVGSVIRPGGRSDMASWAKSATDVTLFGGSGRDIFGTQGTRSEMWKWNGSSWTWVYGKSTNKQQSVYGIKGQFSSENLRSSLYGTTSWKDSDGRMFMYGGYGTDSLGQTGYQDDVWEYSDTGWTWISGNATRDQTPNYGVLNVADPSNSPGGRRYASSWVTSDGALYIMGGECNYYAPSALWKWDGTNWTWVDGDSNSTAAPVYGTKGVAAPNNTPGVRSFSTTWVDSLDRLWLFGGTNRSYQSTSDLWMYDGTDWTWVSGPNLTNQAGVYGTMGVANSANVPPARSGATSWVDEDGNLWLFGGSNPDYTTSDDVWKWDGVNWTWMAGSNISDQVATYGTKGVADPANSPGARKSPLKWIDELGNVWIAGGLVTVGGQYGYGNDYWKWNGTAWAWMAGAQTPGSKGEYGTKGVPSVNNIHPGISESATWLDNHGNLILFGGVGEDYNNSPFSAVNALWKVQIKPDQTIDFEELTDVVCGDTVLLSATSTSGLPVSFTVSDSSIATIINGNQLVTLKSGDVVVTAWQNGNASYMPAAQVDQSQLILKWQQSIVFDSLPSIRFGDTLDVSAMATSEYPVDLISSNPSVAMLVNNKIVAVGVGTAVISASQPGDEKYEAAQTVDQTLIVEKAFQFILIDSIPDVNVDTLTENLPIQAITTSGLLPLVSVSGAAQLDGETLEITGTGAVFITLYQPGNDFFLPSDTVNLSFTVYTSVGLNEGMNIEGLSIFPNPTQGEVTVTTNEQSGKIEVEVIDMNGVTTTRFEGDTQGELRIDLKDLTDGMYYLKVSQGKHQSIQKVIIK